MAACRFPGFPVSFPAGSRCYNALTACTCIPNAALQGAHEARRWRQTLERKRKALEARIAALRAEFEEEQQAVEAAIAEAEHGRQAALRARAELAEKRAGSGERGKAAKGKTS